MPRYLQHTAPQPDRNPGYASSTYDPGRGYAVGELESNPESTPTSESVIFPGGRSEGLVVEGDAIVTLSVLSGEGELRLYDSIQKTRRSLALGGKCMHVTLCPGDRYSLRNFDLTEPLVIRKALISHPDDGYEASLEE